MARPSPWASPVPIIALPIIPPITARTSAKSRLIRPGFIIKSVMLLTPEYRTSSAILKASAKVVFSLATRKRFWLGMMIRVSTLLFEAFFYPLFSSAHTICAFKMKRFCDNTDGKDIFSRAALAMIGAAPVPFPLHIPAVTKSMLLPSIWARTSSILSSADALPTSG